MKEIRTSEAKATLAPRQPGTEVLRPDIAEAILGFQAGDHEAGFRVVFEAYFPAVQRFFARKGLSREDCLDLTQEVFLGVYRGLPTYHPKARFETWLFRIAATTFLKRLRSGRAAKRTGFEVDAAATAIRDTLTTPGRQLEDAVRRELRQELAMAIAALPDQMRKCLTLRVYHDLKYKEIATVMRLSIQTVRAHLFQARKRLQAELGPQAAQGWKWLTEEMQ